MYLGFLGGHVPNSYRLIVGTTRYKFTARTNPGHSNPFPMTRQSFHAITSRDFPNFNGFVSGRAHDEIPLWYETHAVYIMIVAVHCFDAGIRWMKIPYFNRHVGATRDQQFTRNVERYVVYAIRMTFHRSFEFAALEIPNLGDKNNYSYCTLSFNRFTLMVASSLAETTRLKTG